MKYLVLALLLLGCSTVSKEISEPNNFPVPKSMVDDWEQKGYDCSHYTGLNEYTCKSTPKVGRIATNE